MSGAATPLRITDEGALSAEHLSELTACGARLEHIYGDAVDIEFTVEGEHLYFLQVRAAKRTAQAAVRIAADLVDDGILPARRALNKVSAEQLKRLLRPAFEPAALAAASVLTQGIAASPGHAYGVAILDADRAAEAAAALARSVILLRPTTSPQDIRGMLPAKAIVTARGGALSHAAVVSRALDIPCVVGCEHRWRSTRRRTATSRSTAKTSRRERRYRSTVRPGPSISACSRSNRRRTSWMRSTACCAGPTTRRVSISGPQA